MPVTITTEGKQRADRVPSTISFPYSDITDAIAVAEGLLKGGGLPLSRDQIGAAMGLVPNTGSFNTKISTARIFGVLDFVGGKYMLTDLGHEIVDSGRYREAMIRAFLNVELYNKVYEEFRNKRLPPRPHGLERTFIQFGVSPKQAKNARLAFEKSARLAGFYPGGDEDRLVMPFGISSSVEGPPVIVEAVGAASGVGTASAVGAAVSGGNIHKSILGMLEELPAPKAKWSKTDQADWLDAVATLFQVIYKSDDQGEVAVTYMPAVSTKNAE